MKSLRTPDDRFASLPGYDFEPHYVEVSDDEGGCCGSTTSARVTRRRRWCC